MKRVGGKLLVIFMMLLLCSIGNAQMVVDGNPSPTQLVNDYLLGGGITATNISYSGATMSRASFSGGSSTNLGMDQGIILSSGRASKVPGYNSSGMTSINNGAGGDADLDALIDPDDMTDNKSVLEFDFVATSDSIQFRYIFASEEYPEFACGSYNDVFAFLLSGTNPAGGNYIKENLAVIPGTNTFVGVNTINPGVSGNFGSDANCAAFDPNWASYSIYYNDNPKNTPTTITPDGFTDVFFAAAKVVCGETYHIKMAIADGGSSPFGSTEWDSYVFLEANSFTSVGISYQTYEMDQALNLISSSEVTEDCTDGVIALSVTPAPLTDLILSYTIGGTAVNGTDYVNLPGSVTVPAGEDSVAIIISTISDAVEGDETIELTFEDISSCGSSGPQTISITIHDPPGAVTPLCGNTSPSSIEFYWDDLPGVTDYNISYTINGGSSVIDLVTDTVYLVSPLSTGDNVTLTVTPNGNACYLPANVTCSTECSENPGTTFTNSTGPATFSTGNEMFVCYGETIEFGHQTGTYSLNGGVANEMIYFVADVNGETIADRNTYISAQPATADFIDGSGTGSATCSGPGNNILSTTNNGSQFAFNQVWWVYGTSAYPDNPAVPYLNGSVNYDFSCSFFEEFVIYPLNEITADISGICGTGTIDVTSVTGGVPEFKSLNPTELPSLSAYTEYTVSLSGGPTSLPDTNITYNGSASFTGLAPGVYTITIIDGNGCPVIFNSIFISDPSVNATVTSDYNLEQISCFGEADATIECNPNGGIIPYTYNWSHNGGLSSATATGLSTLNNPYTITVTDGGGCTALQSITLNEPSAVSLIASITSDYNGQNISCFGANDGSATALASDGTGSFTYLWSGPVGFTFSDNSLQSQSDLIAGNYSVSATDANGCNTSTTLTLTEPVGLSLSTFVSSDYNGTDISCSGASDGQIDLTVSNGSSPYGYNWSGPAGYVFTDNTTQNQSGLIAGTYYVTVLDANGCSAYANQNITDPDPLSASISVLSDFNGTAISCYGLSDGSAVVNANGGTGLYSYAWVGPAAYTFGDSTNQGQAGLIAGDYYVTVTDVNNCTAISNQNITEPIELISSLAVSSDFNGADISCFGSSDGATDLSVSGGTTPLTFLWNGPVGYTFLDNSSEDQTGLIAGNYMVTTTDANNCITTSSVTLTQPGEMNPVITTNDSHCSQNDGDASVSVTGGLSPYTYSWPSGGSANSEASLSAGTYIVTVTDNNNCIVTANANITDIDGGSINVLTVIHNTCYGESAGQVSVEMSGGVAPFNYLWNTGSSDTLLISLAAGTYTLDVTDNSGCIASGEVTINQPDELLTDIISSTGVSCYGQSDGTATAQSTGGAGTYVYQWDIMAGGQTTAMATGITEGQYIITVTDDSLCVATDTITITQPDSLIAIATYASDYNSYQISCFGLYDGSINLTTTGGTQNYSWSWAGSNGFTSQLQNLNGLYEGTYNVTVTDAKGCTDISQLILTEPEYLSANGAVTSLFSNSNVSCYNDTIGSAEVIVSGGAGSYVYSWEGPAGFTSDIDSLINLTAGVYSVTVADQNGCSDTSVVTLYQPDSLESIAIITSDYNNWSVSCFGLADGEVDLTIAGGTEPYDISWTGPGSFTSANEDLSSIMAGTYNSTITDANGCTSLAEVILSEPDTLIANAQILTNYNGWSVTCNGSNNANIDLSTSGGSGAYTFAWTGPAGYSSTGEDIYDLYAGSYNVIVTDNNNCSVSTNITATEPEVLSASINVTSDYNGSPISCYGLNDGSIDLIVSGGTSDYLYFWTANTSYISNEEDLIGLYSGNYQVTVTDQNSCQAVSTITLTQPELFTGFVSYYNDIICAGDDNGSIIVSLSGGKSPYTYSWSEGTLTQSTTATTDTISGLSGGDYSVNLTDNNNCSFVIDQSIEQPELLTVIASTENILCNGDKTGSITAIVNGGTLPYDFIWSTGDTIAATTNSTSEMNNLIAQTEYYIVDVYDNNGCHASDSSLLTEPMPFVIDDTVTSNVDCYLGTNGSIEIYLSGGTEPYSFDWEDLNAYNILYGLDAGVYYVTISDANNCNNYAARFSITQPDEMSYDIETITTTCNVNDDGAVNLELTGGTSPFTFFWSNGESTEDLSDVHAGEYSITINDANNCTLEIEAVVPAGNESCLFIPKAFTPNNDDKNNTWGIKHIELYNIVTVEIFNRWGQKLYSFVGTGVQYSDPGNQWDGEFKGKKVPAGSYLYIVKIDEMKPFKGTLTLIR